MKSKKLWTKKINFVCLAKKTSFSKNKKKMSLEEKNPFFDCRLDITCNNDEFLEFFGHRHKLSKLAYCDKLFTLSIPDEIIIEQPKFLLVFKINVPFSKSTIECFLKGIYDHDFDIDFNDPMDIMFVGLYFGVENDLILILQQVINKYMPNRLPLESKRFQDNVLKFLSNTFTSAIPNNIVNSLLTRYYGCLHNPEPLLKIIKDKPNIYFDPNLIGYHNGILYLPEGCREVEYDDMIFNVYNTNATIDKNDSYGFWITCKKKSDPIKVERVIEPQETGKEANVKLFIFDCFSGWSSEIITMDYKKTSIVFPTPYEYSYRGYARARCGTTTENDLFHFAYCFEITFL